MRSLDGARALEDLLELLAQLRRARTSSRASPRSRQPTLRARPAEVGLEDLADVHAGGDAQRVEDDVHRAAVLQVGHVLLGQDPRDDALVAVAAGHLVAHRQLALDGDVDLDHLDDARRQLVALLEAADLLAEEQLRRARCCSSKFSTILRTLSCDVLVPATAISPQ